MNIVSPNSFSTFYESTPYLTVHNIGSTISELYELLDSYMLIHESFDFFNDTVYFSSFTPSGGNTFTTTISGNAPIISGRSLHQHDYFELMILLKGSLTHYVNDRCYEYHAGQVCLLNHNIKHVESITQDVEVFFLSLSDSFLEKLFPFDFEFRKQKTNLSAKHPFYQIISNNRKDSSFYQKQYLDFIPLVPATLLISKLEPLLGKIIIETNEQELGFFNLVQGYIARIFSILCNPSFYHINSITSTSSKEEYLFIKIQRILEERKGNISRDELANILNYNAHYLNRIVKKRSGMSLLKYGQIFRLREATRMLLYSDLSVSQIMKELGFTNHSFFYQIFVAKYGMTPKEYRDNYKNKSNTRLY